MKVLSSWSGGKDSCFALQKAIVQGYAPVALLNILNENGMVSRSHAIPLPILQQQAAALQLPLIATASSWSEYETNFIAALQQAKEQYQIEAVVFGDIDLQAHKDWEEKVCKAVGLKAILPLWQQDRKALVLEMLNQNIDTQIVSCNTVMGESYLTQKLSIETVNELEKLGIDACGENGEYHTLVTHCNLFANKINVNFGEKYTYENYCFVKMN